VPVGDECNKQMSHSNSILFRNQGFRQAPLLLLELTYLDVNDSQLAQDRGHLNIVDIQNLSEYHDWVTNSGHDTKRTIVFYHVSRKHKSVGTILDLLKKNLPSQILQFAKVAVSAFGGKTLADVPFDTDGCVSLMDNINLKT
jgi:hypothetical protein